MLYYPSMIPQGFRLKGKRNIEILYAEGRFIATPLLTLKIWYIQPEKYPKRKYAKEDLKIGFVVGLKVSKSAVKRNRLKRQMREVVRLLLQENKIRRGSMMLFIAKKEMLHQEYQEIEKNIVQALLNARVLL